MRKLSHRELKPFPQILHKSSAGLPSGDLGARHVGAATAQKEMSSMS